MHSFSGTQRSSLLKHLVQSIMRACLLPSHVALATDFGQCLADVRSNKLGPVGLDSVGRNITNANASAVSYDICISACGAGQEPFQWSVFSQQFSSWLLPWLALVSQLPFGANDKLENLESVLLTMGSPTLAAYSLTLTVLNGRWIARRFASYHYPNTRNAVRILSSLQQSPLRVTTESTLLASLVILPHNDEWWKELVLWLDYTHTWSISAVTSIAWVVIAYLFTVVDSFTGNIIAAVNANGQGVGSLWLWLLPIVIGWLQISPKCDSVRLSNAVKRANTIAYVATEDEPRLASSKSDQRAISLNFENEDETRQDEQCTAPVYNYARFLPWVQAVEDVSDAFRAASYRCHSHESVTAGTKWEDSGDVPHRNNRMGTIPDVEVYCQPPPVVIRPLRSRWGPGVVSRMLMASALALLLQWGTTGAAVVVVWFTPTKGLGCRSAAYVAFGVLSTVVWLMLVTSSVLTHYSTMQPREYKSHAISPVAVRVARSLSIILRRLGKFIAALNAVWIIVTCMFQFSNFFDRCYCNSSVFGLGKHAYNVMEPTAVDVTDMRIAWIGGVCLAGGTAVIFTGFVNLFINPPLPE
ncbi:hypothetical protein BDQ12DRAFT_707705 [Crucibulum laeve]|uniref:Uncharacterized protein n=1 Tax=Crucibulum laeve TaxID=68775 RepID=A0A5C3LGN8_9AGAR|nr:hypothetical protein BDQ12DRAFT_707705 [Crucibulum laeve]